MLPYNRKMKSRARDLRKNATPQEDKLWYQFLRKHSCPFARQKTIDNYIVDFYCHSRKLVIEIDGSQHFTNDGLDYDKARTDLLKSADLRVIRFTNNEIDNYFNEVCAKIQNYIDMHKNPLL